MTLERCKDIFEKNGYEFRYAKTLYNFPDDNIRFQHHVITRRLKDGKNMCRQVHIGDDYECMMERLVMDTEQLDSNFKRVFKEDIVRKLLIEIDEHTR